ncbi:AraC family transcriptional regulator [Echinicola sp. 20G]|uniref:AraC family transcriptional regulator n=1 Tax=Echinicola sp. 20G TaxID=2781961 RepID=UPI0019104590|nr:AraC family transcriptional regulator [Echinicola sp. 20G]
MLEKNEGFQGQKVITLPPSILEACQKHCLLADFYISDIGYYPRAQHHYRERNCGTEQYILIYCVEGRGWMETEGGKQMEVHPNEYVILPSKIPHRYGASKDSPWTIFWVHFNGDKAAEISSLLYGENGALVKHASFSDERIHWFNKVYTLLESGYRTENLLMANIYLKSFLVSLAYGERVNGKWLSQEKKEINDSIEFMKENLENPLALEEIASHVNLSKSHFAFLFKKNTGYTPIVYFNHLKIQRACQYLRFTDHRISQIAQNVGIDDAYYFSRLFSKSMGISPKDYRNRKQ